VSKNISLLAGKHQGSLFNKIVEGNRSDIALADKYNLGASTIPGARSFYDWLNKEQPEAYVCSGTACLCKGGQEGVRTELEKHFTHVGEMKCLGRCYENNAFHLRSKPGTLEPNGPKSSGSSSTSSKSGARATGYNFSGKDIKQLKTILTTGVEPKTSISSKCLRYPLIRSVLKNYSIVN